MSIHDCHVAYLAGADVVYAGNTSWMAEKAAYLTDNVFSRLPVRQWVLSVPKRLHCSMQRDGQQSSWATRKLSVVNTR